MPNIADEISEMTRSPNWSKLEAPLVAILLLDSDDRVTDEELESAFGCDVSCDFTTRIDGQRTSIWNAGIPAAAQEKIYQIILWKTCFALQNYKTKRFFCMM